MAEETTTTEEVEEETTTSETEVEETTSDESEETQVDWKAMARKHEREAKKARKDADAKAAALKKREEADKSEQEKAVDKAREEGKAEALTEAQKERRADRLENAVLKAASKAITIGDGDDAKTLKFDDPDDALAFIERALAKEAIDDEDVFDSDGKVQADFIDAQLKELLSNKPNLASGDTGGRTATGSSDAGRGKPVSTDLEEMSIEDHAKRKREAK